MLSLMVNNHCIHESTRKFSIMVISKQNRKQHITMAYQPAGGYKSHFCSNPVHVRHIVIHLLLLVIQLELVQLQFFPCTVQCADHTRNCILHLLIIMMPVVFFLQASAKVDTRQHGLLEADPLLYAYDCSHFCNDYKPNQTVKTDNPSRLTSDRTTRQDTTT